MMVRKFIILAVLISLALATTGCMNEETSGGEEKKFLDTWKREDMGERKNRWRFFDNNSLKRWEISLRDWHEFGITWYPWGIESIENKTIYIFDLGRNYNRTLSYNFSNDEEKLTLDERDFNKTYVFTRV